MSANPTANREPVEPVSADWSQGDPTETILIAVGDVTKHKQAARALEASEIRYRRLFETAQDAILILDGDTGKIIDSNPFLSDLLGYSADELLGKELWEIGLFQDIEASRAAFRQLQEKGYIRYEDLPLETKDGRRAYVEFVSNVYPVEGHQVIQCNIRDISDRKRAEEALRQADRRKDEFLAMLAHELRNPLASIRNAVHVMQRRGTDDRDVQSARDVAERQVQQLTRLVDDLLDVSRISQGKINLQMEPVDLAAVVARAVEISRPLIDARKHSLEMALPEQAVRVEGDLTRLAQVVSNLLTNAAKYTEEGGRIDLTVEPSGGEAALRVRDTGVGIAADMLPHIFEMFTQAQGSVSRSEGGLGIGLTLVRSLVEMHGGSVAAHSDGHGHGSEFVVRLPLLREAAPRRAHLLPSSPERTNGFFLGRPACGEGRLQGKSFPYPMRRSIMALAAEKELEHIGETSGCKDHDHDLIHDLSKRLDALWRYDQYIANAEGKPQLQNLWRDLKRQEIDNIKRVKQMITEEIRQNCF